MNFEFDDFIHIREKFDDDWWIGRVISHDHNMGFIPSPVKIEKIRTSGIVFVKPIIRDLSHKNR